MTDSPIHLLPLLWLTGGVAAFATPPLFSPEMDFFLKNKENDFSSGGEPDITNRFKRIPQLKEE